METNTNIKIVRLQSGEDIIANYFVDDENGTIMLDNPMHIIFKRISSGQTMMMMMPWLPIELIKDNHAIIDSHDVLTIINPKDNLIKHYGDSILELQQRMKDKENENPFEDDDDDDEEEDEVELKAEEIMKLMHQKKKSSLH